MTLAKPGPSLPLTLICTWHHSLCLLGVWGYLVFLSPQLQGQLGRVIMSCLLTPCGAENVAARIPAWVPLMDGRENRCCVLWIAVLTQLKPQKPTLEPKP